MKVNALEDEIKASRQQRRGSFVILLLFLILGALNFSLIHNALPSLNAIGPQGMSGAQGQPGIALQGPRGETGLQGIRGEMGLQGIQGTAGSIGEIGPVGPQGSMGEPGTPAKQLEQRCVQPETGRPMIQQRYTGDDSWQLAYYLPEGSSCE